MKDKEYNDRLSQALGGFRVTPPEQSWARIEHSLDALDSTRAAAPVSIRRPLKRPMAKGAFWRYASAAVVAAGVIFAGYRFMEREGQVDPTPQMAITVPEPVTVAPVQTIEQPVLAAARPRAVVALTQPTLSLRIPPQELPEEKFIAGPQPTAAVPQQAAGQATQQGAQQTTSSTPPRRPSYMVPFTPEVPAMAAPKRKTSTLAASLYAVNSGMTKGESLTTTQRAITRSGLDPSAALDAGSYNTVAGEYFGAEPLTTSAYQSVSAYQTLTNATHHLPLSIGLGLTWTVHGNWKLESGAIYTYLSSSSTATAGMSETVIKQQLHYVGIPLNLSYYFASSRACGFYARAGATLERGVYGTQKMTMKTAGTPSGSQTEKVKFEGFLGSVGASVGAELRLGRTVSLYIEPGVSHFYQIEPQPANYYTDNNFAFTLRGGLRFSLN